MCIRDSPNSLKFLPGKTVSNDGSFEVTKKEKTDNELIRNLLSINGVIGIFLGADFISINKEEKIKIPETMNYDDLSSLSNEIKEKLSKIKPKNIAQASRIDGVTPAALGVILAHIKTQAKLKKLA